MSIELPVRPVSAAVEQVTEVVESGVAKAGASLGAVFDRLGELDLRELDLGELDLDETVRDAAGRLRSEADHALRGLERSGERDRLALVAATALVIVVVVASVFLARRRGAPARNSAKKAARRRRA